MKSSALLLSLLCMAWAVGAQKTAGLHGQISDREGPLSGVNVALPELQRGAITDETGHYHFDDLPAGELLMVASYLGYRTVEQRLSLRPGDTQTQNLTMEEDVLGLEAVVVSATRSALPIYQAPVMVNRISDRVFERTQSLSLAEGLSFSPGLRLENNCQNCGFTQLRMNGLDGPYTQILINGRAIFSALAGVYGLEMIPANMIERVEVVRGGGSALYGGNAIAGTVNVITKDPTASSFSFGTNYALTQWEAPDVTLTLNGSIVSEDLNKGLNFFANRRSRQPWDANGDEFSELTQIDNTTFGFDAFVKPDERSKLSVNAFVIDEFRRGGNKFDLPPHQADIAEQLDHKLLAGGFTYERFSADNRHKAAVYGSAQGTRRDSYYGGGGRTLAPTDTLTPTDVLALNAYGQSEDLALVGGLQYTFDAADDWLLVAGSEYQLNRVDDRMPGYGREIVQRVGTWGSYAQVQWSPNERWSYLLGGRFDVVDIDGDYNFVTDRQLNQRQFRVAVPRATIKYSVNRYFKFRASYAEGYRAPQAFDEDLHIETVGGAARFTVLDPGLRTERSHSANVSADYTWRHLQTELNVVVDGFYNRLRNPFINVDQRELPSGIAVVTKRNGSGATVGGANVEVNAAFRSRWVVQLGATLQTARYDEAETLWAPAEPTEDNRDSLVQISRLLRTPAHYGFMTATWTPVKALDLSLSGVYTGSMPVAHVIDPDTEYTIIRDTPSFFELNVRAAWRLRLSADYQLQLTAGVQNLFNSYQQDFDRGPARDAGYVYGPSRPRTVFVGAKVLFE